MADPISVIVRRGGVVEATHLVHGVTVGRDGRVIATCGDHRLVTLLRSSAKPFQALPLARAFDDLDNRELAIASASHLAHPEQVDTVRLLLARAGADEHDLDCGPAGHPPSPLNHNCSGKHAGMLAVCRAHGWPKEGYRLAGHPMQRQNLRDVAGTSGVAEDGVATAVDGCGVVTFALELHRMATMFTRLEDSPEGKSVADAMRAEPDLLRGPDSTDTMLVKLVPGTVAKGGAEGLICGVLPDGTGFAFKCVDGSSRALRPALGRFFAAEGLELPEFAEVPLVNNRDEEVGSMTAV